MIFVREKIGMGMVEHYSSDCDPPCVRTTYESTGLLIKERNCMDLTLQAYEVGIIS